MENYLQINKYIYFCYYSVGFIFELELDLRVIVRQFIIININIYRLKFNEIKITQYLLLLYAF